VAESHTADTLVSFRDFGGQDSQNGTSIAVDIWDNVVVTGSFYDYIYFGGDFLTSAGFTDIFLAKLVPEGIVVGVTDTPREQRLDIRAYPNPFNPEITITYSIPNPGWISLHIYDVKGRLLKTLINKPQSRGEFKVNWDGRNHNGQRVGSGVYFYKLTAKNFTKTKKMILLK
jgi:hypothetical protein